MSREGHYREEDTHVKEALYQARPALVIASFALMPAVAQAKFPATCVVEAKCHYYINSTSPSPATLLKEGEDRATLSGGAAHVVQRGQARCTCQIAAVAEDIENPVGGGAGRGETENFAVADCFAAGCEPATLLEMDVTAEKLPWASELTENQEENKVTTKRENVIRDHTLAVGPGVQWLNSSTMMTVSVSPMPRPWACNTPCIASSVKDWRRSW